MKRLFTALLTMIVVAPMLMATQCSSYMEPQGNYYVKVENKSDLNVDTLYVGYQSVQQIKDTSEIVWNWGAYKIDNSENQKQGYVTELMYSHDDKYCFELRTADSKVVADTIITLKQLPQDADDIKVILILEKTGELRIDKQPIKRAN